MHALYVAFWLFWSLLHLTYADDYGESNTCCNPKSIIAAGERVWKTQKEADGTTDGVELKATEDLAQLTSVLAELQPMSVVAEAKTKLLEKELTVSTFQIRPLLELAGQELSMRKHRMILTSTTDIEKVMPSVQFDAVSLQLQTAINPPLSVPLYPSPTHTGSVFNDQTQTARNSSRKQTVLN